MASLFDTSAAQVAKAALLLEGICCTPITPQQDPRHVAHFVWGRLGHFVIQQIVRVDISFNSEDYNTKYGS